ncbi:MAG: site-2 protease family protein [Candidatus Omnitrophota bacterium]
MILSFIAFFFALSLHECAHAWCAYKLGDSTAKDAGRVTFNPLAHIDIWGTVLFPAILVWTHAPIVFGWAKPVPINFWNLRNRRLGMALVGLAGPASNFASAILASLALRLFPFSSFPALFLQLFILVNLVLGLFNLIPIPPLDGSRLLIAVLPPRFRMMFAHLERYGLIVALVAIVWLGLWDKIIWPAVRFLFRALVG